MKLVSVKKSDDSCIVTNIKCQQETVEVLWFADLHIDSKHTDKKEVKRILKKHPKALIIIGGDSIDAMQNKRDPRASYSDLADELKHSNYLNRLAKMYADFWMPYAERIICINQGNHDSALIRHYGIDVIEYAADLLRVKNPNIICGDYQGWIKMKFDNHGRNFSKNIYFAHAPISGGSRSKGVLSVDIIKGRFPDADVFISEHIHTTWMMPQSIERFNGSGQIENKTMWFLSMPTMKDEFKGKKRGFVAQKNFDKAPVGAMLLNFEISKKGVNITPNYELVF